MKSRRAPLAPLALLSVLVLLSAGADARPGRRGRRDTLGPDGVVVSPPNAWREASVGPPDAVREASSVGPPASIPEGGARAPGEPEHHNYLEKMSLRGLRIPKHLAPESPAPGASPTFRLSASGPKSATLETNTTSLEGQATWVTVKVTGIEEPGPDDTVALFVPPDSLYEGASPVKYEFLSSATGYLESGEAELSLSVLNLRQDARFVVLRGGFARHGSIADPELVARGPVLVNLSPNEPTGVHLMLGHRPSDMLVQWTTRDAGTPIVRFGLTPGSLAYAVPAVTRTYSRSDLRGAPANSEGWLDPGSLHTAIMGGLTPGREYWYSVGDELSGPLTEPRRFLAHPGVGPDVAVSILGVADQGVGEPDGATAAEEYSVARNVARLLAAEARGSSSADPESIPGPYRLLIHNGDISYARGYGALWDGYLHQQRELLDIMPVVVSIANHERDCLGEAFYRTSEDSGGECGVPYYARFPMPRPNLAADQAFYSFDFGPAHFSVMSTEHDFTEGSPQHLWLEGDLGSVDRAKTPWLFLVGHRPIYVDADDFSYPTGKQTTAIQLQTALEDLLSRYRVDVVLSGHHHSYQRTCPVRLGVCVEPKRSNAPLETPIEGAPEKEGQAPRHRVVELNGDDGDDDAERAGSRAFEEGLADLRRQRDAGRLQEWASRNPRVLEGIEAGGALTGAAGNLTGPSDRLSGSLSASYPFGPGLGADRPGSEAAPWDALSPPSRLAGKHKHSRHHSGTVHLLFGNGGAEFYDNGFAERPPWAEAVFMRTHGYVRMHLNATRFFFEAVDVADGQVFDSVEIRKKQHKHRPGGSPFLDDRAAPLAAA